MSFFRTRPAGAEPGYQPRNPPLIGASVGGEVHSSFHPPAVLSPDIKREGHVHPQLVPHDQIDAIAPDVYWNILCTSREVDTTTQGTNGSTYPRRDVLVHSCAVSQLASVVTPPCP